MTRYTGLSSTPRKGTGAFGSGGAVGGAPGAASPSSAQYQLSAPGRGVIIYRDSQRQLELQR